MDAAVRQSVELFADESQRPLHFQPAHLGAGKDVARVPGRHGDVGETINAIREITADVARRAGRTGRYAHQPQLLAHVNGRAPTPSKRAITEGVFQSSSTALRTSRVTEPMLLKLLDQARSTSTATPPGPNQPPAEAVAAQQGRHVEHVAADASAIGRGGQEATSPASPPRSPMWFASRSNSRAMPRRNWPLAGTRLR